MKLTTLCYIEKDGCYLMLYRNKKQQDPNAGKWIGVGGHIEPGETPEECIRREVTEETGLTLTELTKRGEILFRSPLWPEEKMYLFTSGSFTGSLTECKEGELSWIPVREVSDLPLWEGDRIFLKRLTNGDTDIRLTLCYDEKDCLKEAREEQQDPEH